MGILAYFRVFGVELAGVRGCVKVVTGWCWRRRPVLDAVGPTGAFPSAGSGPGLVYGGARVGVRLVGRGVGEAAVVSGFVCSAWPAPMLLGFLGRRAVLLLRCLGRRPVRALRTNRRDTRRCDRIVVCQPSPLGGAPTP